MLKKIKKYLKKNQKGALLFMTAASIAAMMFCGAVVVDLGSMYAHKSELQNAADAAAMAGAHAYADNNESTGNGNHTHADSLAKEYIDKTLGDGNTATPKYMASDNNGNKVYYRVKLEDQAPTYFLKFFGLEPTVSVDGIAVIATTKSGGTTTTTEETSASGRDLFIFRKNMSGVNAIENPDNFDKEGQIVTTFDGTIAFTDGSGQDYKDSYKYNKLEYSTQGNGKLQHFFTQKARDEKLSVNQAIEKGDEYAHKETYIQYDMDELGGLVQKEMGIPDYVSAPTEYSKNSVFNSTYPRDNQGNVQKSTINSQNLTSNVAYTAVNGDGNVTIQIDSSISGNTNNPVYVYLDESISQVNFNVNTNNERPLILVYMGNGKLHMNMSANNTFRGIVYAPNVNPDEGVLINANGGTFSGSIIANSINLQGGKGTYKYENFNIKGTSGKSSSSSSSGSSGTITSRNINLADIDPDDKNITWDA